MCVCVGTIFSAIILTKSSVLLFFGKLVPYDVRISCMRVNKKIVGRVVLEGDAVVLFTATTTTLVAFFRAKITEDYTGIVAIGVGGLNT